MVEIPSPKLLVGAFIFDGDGRLFLRTTPSQGNRYTCINGKVEWGKTIEETLRENVKRKTNLDITSVELIGLTDGLDITMPDSREPVHFIFADYKAVTPTIKNFKSDKEDREYHWLSPRQWLEKGKDSFGPYIYEVIERLERQV